MSQAWGDAAACRSEDPDLFHPDDPEGVERAKAVCRRCPIADACLQHALDNRIDDGVLGGLTGPERVSLRRATIRHQLSREAVMARAAQARQAMPEAPRPRTVQEHVARHTVRIFGGHVEWAGPKRPWINGKSYTPSQVVFIADRGRQPEGHVVASCAHGGCIKPSHITDGAERRQAAAWSARSLGVAA